MIPYILKIRPRTMHMVKNYISVLSNYVMFDRFEDIPVRSCDWCYKLYIKEDELKYRCYSCEGKRNELLREKLQADYEEECRAELDEFFEDE